MTDLRFGSFAGTSSTESLGTVLGVRGSEARVGLPAPSLSEALRATVGTFLAIAAGAHRLIGVVTEVDSNSDNHGARFGAVARVDLMGEIKWTTASNASSAASPPIPRSATRRASSAATSCG